MYWLAYRDQGGVVHAPVVALHTVAKRSAPATSGGRAQAATRSGTRWRRRSSSAAAATPAAAPANGRTSPAKTTQQKSAAMRPPEGRRSTASAATKKAATLASDVLCERKLAKNGNTFVAPRSSAAAPRAAARVRPARRAAR